ncbi:sensor domain-containing diguanylate cyclase [Photobacterium frigidiphilum]|uniref:diguanylate cyclase n=1 Tax=Photobacterium frigidiphilum TaxID=264736 RepID=A0A2T3J954_9GAMM|nr:diguanylate cyclase [Photobacterium frigidiphilum]PSU45344.1 sensor domain-containing diguanylate cyclase [Photobacterium frigidiphilum]
MFNLKHPYRLTLTLYFLGFGVIVALVTSFINYKISFVDLDETLHEISKSEVSFKRDYLSGYIKNSEILLSSIVKSDLTKEFVLSNDVNDKINATNLFYALALSDKDVMQLRYIDRTGKEIIRIDRNSSTDDLHFISDDNMQNKKERYYFKEAAILKENQYWYSNVDLNVEHGEIELPLKPTFRVATPLIINDQFYGVVVVNLLFSETINFLSFSENFNIYLATGDGDIIHHPDNSQSWSQYFPDLKRLDDIFPNSALNILTSNAFYGPGIYSYSLGDLFGNKDNLKVIFIPKLGVMQTMQNKNVLSALLIALTVLAVSFPLSWFASIMPSRLQSKLSEAYDKIKKNAAVIDKHVMILCTDRDGVIKKVNMCFAETTGYATDEVIGKKQRDFRHSDTSLEAYDEIHELILTGKVWEGELKETDKEGNDLWVHKFITPDINENGMIDGFTTIVQNITDKKNIELLSITDSLTGLYNRYKLESVLSSESSRCERYQSDFSVIIFDIDFFKKINDTYGHLVGDDVLIHLARLLKENTRITDVTSRWGGEEFLIVACNTNLHEAFIFAEKLRIVIENYNFPSIGKMTISCGVAQYINKETISELVSRADFALYQAKKMGKNKVVKAK